MTGEQVVVIPIRGCNDCISCNDGQPHVCENPEIIGLHTDGGMADFVTVPADQLFILPSDYSFLMAALLEPTAVAVHAITDRVEIADDDFVVVQGVGPIGLLLALTVRHTASCSLLVAGTNADRTDRLPVARELGFETVNVQEADLGATVRDYTAGRGTDVILDATGHPTGLEQALDVIGTRGTIVTVGTPYERASTDVSRIVRNEVTVTGSFAAKKQNFEQATQVLDSGVDEGMITTCYRPADRTKPFEDLLNNQVIKPIIQFDEDNLLEEH